MIRSFLVSGKLSIYAIISAANFTALMWPCIFMLAIKDLGQYTHQDSSLLVMMIPGGAVIPPLQGLLSDHQAIGVHGALLLPVCCFSYIAWYAFALKNGSLKAPSLLGDAES